MTFPTVTETGAIQGADHTSSDVTLPSFNDGDLIIVAIIGDTSQAQTWTHDGATNHWTQLWDRANGSNVRMDCRYRKMVEGDSTTITLSWTNSERAGWTILQIPAGEYDSTTAPATATATSGTGTGANPPSVTPSWGSADTLALAICGGDIYVVLDSGPSGYTTFTQHRIASDSGSVNIQSAYKQTTASPEDPGNFTYHSTNYWVAGTILVKPSVATSASAGVASATGTAETSAGSLAQPAGVAEATAAAGGATAVGGTWAYPGVASASVTEQPAADSVAPSPAAPSATAEAHSVVPLFGAITYPGTASATGEAPGAAGREDVPAGYGTATAAAYGPTVSVPVFTAADAGLASATAAAGAPLPGVSAAPLYALARAWAPEAGSANAIARGAPFVLTLGGVDVSAMTVTGFSFDASLGSVPSASLTVADLDETLTPPLGTAFPELVIATADDTLFSGPVLNWRKRRLYPGVEYELRAEGWARNLGMSPVPPPSMSAASVDGPLNSTWNTWTGTVIGASDLGSDWDANVIAQAMLFFNGPALTQDIGIAYHRTAVWWTYRPEGAALGSVLDEIARRLGYNDTYWIDGAKVFHWRPGYAAVYDGSPVSVPVEHLAPFRLADVPGGGAIVPTTVSESGEGSSLREGIHVVGIQPTATATITPGPQYAGMETLQTRAYGYDEAAGFGLAALAGKLEWARSLSITLPAGSPVPPLGSFLEIDYDDLVGGGVIRSVRGTLVVPGEGILGVEWTLDVGDAEKRSYVRESSGSKDLGTEVDKEVTPPVKVAQLEVGDVSDMGLGSVQYVYAWPEDADGNRVRVESGKVLWSIWLSTDGTTSTNVGAGAAALGWWLTAQETDIAWTENEPLGFAYCELHCDTPAEPGVDAVQLTAELVLA